MLFKNLGNQKPCSELTQVSTPGLMVLCALLSVSAQRDRQGFTFPKAFVENQI